MLISIIVDSWKPQRFKYLNSFSDTLS